MTEDGVDFGVLLTVVGAVLLSLAQISRVERRSERERIPEGPMDIRLPTAREAALVEAQLKTEHAAEAAAERGDG